MQLKNAPILKPIRCIAWWVFIFLLSFPLITQASPTIELGAEQPDIAPFGKATRYGMTLGYEWLDGLAIGLGGTMMQTVQQQATGIHIGFPVARIHQTFKINRRWQWLVGAGFSLNHGSHQPNGAFIGTHGTVGVMAQIRSHAKVSLQWMIHQGKRGGISYNGQSLYLGIRASLFPQKKRSKEKPPFQYSPTPKPRPSNRNTPNSTYRQTQQLMNDLSWPTY